MNTTPHRWKRPLSFVLFCLLLSITCAQFPGYVPSRQEQHETDWAYDTETAAAKLPVVPSAPVELQRVADTATPAPTTKGSPAAASSTPAKTAGPVVYRGPVDETLFKLQITCTGQGTGEVTLNPDGTVAVKVNAPDFGTVGSTCKPLNANNAWEIFGTYDSAGHTYRLTRCGTVGSTSAQGTFTDREFKADITCQTNDSGLKYVRLTFTAAR